MKDKLFRSLGWLLFGGFLYLTFQGFYAGYLAPIEVADLGRPSLSARRYQFYLVLSALTGLAWLVTLLLIWLKRGPWRLLNGLLDGLARLPIWLRWLAGALIALSPSYLFLFSSFGKMPFGYWFRLAVLLGTAFIAALLVFPRRPLIDWLVRYACVVAVSGAVFTLGGWLNGVTGYPFSIGWSEGNRFWDFSILFGKDRYKLEKGTQLVAFISEGRQFLWALPFLLPDLSIWGMRLWDALLWIVPPLMVCAAAVAWQPGDKKGRVWKLIYVLWGFVFLTQGPIYAPLLVSAFIAVIAVRRKNLAVSLLLVILASYYASISRWTWMYACGLWAGSLALLDEDNPGFSRAQWKTLIRPAALGLAGLFGGQFLPALVRQISATWTNTVAIDLMVNPTHSLSRQPLVWARLLPNPTYAPGILLGALWAGLPLAALLFWLWKKGDWKMNWLQGLGALLPNLAFLVVGLVASTKIGGGSNLHNLDMFWIGLVLLAGWALKRLNLAEMRPRLAGQPVFMLLLALVLIFPTTYAAQSGEPLSLPDSQLVDATVETIQRQTLRAQQRGPVLFMDQRQLLTFGYVQGITLIPDYEKKFVMDQAMEGNPIYFDKFYQDLEARRFSMIVSEPLREGIANADKKNFAQENNDWVQWVSGPVLKYYRPLVTIHQVGVQLLVPREQ